MFVRFVYDSFCFCAHDFPAKPKKNATFFPNCTWYRLVHNTTLFTTKLVCTFNLGFTLQPGIITSGRCFTLKVLGYVSEITTEGLFGLGWFYAVGVFYIGELTL